MNTVLDHELSLLRSRLMVDSSDEDTAIVSIIDAVSDARASLRQYIDGHQTTADISKVRNERDKYRGDFVVMSERCAELTVEVEILKALTAELRVERDLLRRAIDESDR